MSKSARIALAILTFDETSHGYTTTHVNMMAGKVVSIADRRAAVLAGHHYYKGDGEEPILRAVKHLKIAEDAGYSHIFDYDRYDLRLLASFQHYKGDEPTDETQYCEPRFDVSDDSREIVRNAALLARITAVYSGYTYGRTPKMLIDAVASLRGIDVYHAERIATGEKYGSTYGYDYAVVTPPVTVKRARKSA